MSSCVKGPGGELTMYLKHCHRSQHFVYGMGTGGNPRDASYLEALVELGLLLVNDAEAEIYLICLFKVRLDLHDLRESLFGIFVAPVAIVENANAVPEHRILWDMSECIYDQSQQLGIPWGLSG